MALEVLVGSTSGALFAALLVFREHVAIRGDNHEIDSPLAAFVRLTWGLGGLVLIAAALFIIGVFWTWMAT